VIVWDLAQGSIAVEVLADHPLTDELEFHRLFEHVLDDPFAVLLDSAASASRFSRRSVIAIEPEAALVARSSPLLAAGLAQLELHVWDDDRCVAPSVRRFQGAPFAELDRMLIERHLPAELRSQLPEGFVGGAIGFSGYDAGRFLERLPERAARDLDLPELCFLFVDSVLLYEHDTRVLRWVASARGRDGSEAQQRCQARMAQLRARFAPPPRARTEPMSRALAPAQPRAGAASTAEPAVEAGEATRALDATQPRAGAASPADARAEAGEADSRALDTTQPRALDAAQPRFAESGGATHVDSAISSAARSASDAGAIGELRVQISPDAYAEMVRAAKAQISAGNVFEVCTSQRLEAEFPRDRRAIWHLYLALRRRSPAAFACCVLTPFAALLSSSPERFLQLSQSGWAESRPIKGTRPRGDTAEADARLRDELASSEKDRAENVMIVDLVRNDLGRVCAVDSVHVPELMIIEAHPSVFHMVSTIRGQLEQGVSAVQLFAACFPPGSMTGAPKIEAMKVIDALEPVRRGIYAGAVGYFDLGGALDFSVVIRSFVVSDGRCTFNVGGAVVADSDPEAEYRESMDKARALVAALDDQRGRAR
jgi:anthranilate/para-aminobenzoate synthase component I